MIIVDPVTLGDVACTRASPKWAFDRTGTLVQVPANVLAVTYDPSDLSKAPYALVEPAMTNLFAGSQVFSTTYWATPQTTVTANAGTAPDGTDTASRFDFVGSNCYVGQGNGSPTGLFTFSAFVNTADRCLFVGGGGLYTETFEVAPLPNGWFRQIVRFNMISGSLTPIFSMPPPRSILAWGAQLVAGSDPGSYIPTTTAPANRAADVIAPGAGLVYSNVPITERTYSAGATFAKDELAYDPATHNVFQSLIAGNTGKALTDTTAWTPRGATNRWAMLDQYNNTQTTNPDEILIVVSPQAISQGLYLGNLLADEVRISVVDLTEGLVYSETKSLIESNSGSSFFNWAFKRIKRRDYFLTLKLLPYANALVTISLRKIGGTAKCGMCAIGPTDDFGPTLMGLSTEGKDYSSTTFNFDGTSSTVIRPYAKRMSCDVMVDNDQIDYLQARLFEIRQKPVVWVGGPYGSTAVYGRYESFKNVIQYATRSLMNLTIGGAV